MGEPISGHPKLAAQPHFKPGLNVAHAVNYTVEVDTFWPQFKQYHVLVFLNQRTTHLFEHHAIGLRPANNLIQFTLDRGRKLRACSRTPRVEKLAGLLHVLPEECMENRLWFHRKLRNFLRISA